MDGRCCLNLTSVPSFCLSKGLSPVFDVGKAHDDMGNQMPTWLVKLKWKRNWLLLEAKVWNRQVCVLSEKKCTCRLPWERFFVVQQNGLKEHRTQSCRSVVESSYKTSEWQRAQATVMWHYFFESLCPQSLQLLCVFCPSRGIRLHPVGWKMQSWLCKRNIKRRSGIFRLPEC